MLVQPLVKPHPSEQRDMNFSWLPGIVKRINDQLTYSHDYPFNTLEPDWDIVAQFAHTLKTYGNNLTITQVKSHQDDKIPLDKLNLPARLNVADDHLATCYSLQHGIPHLK
eukprot:12439657-Ditylum_brightwellii.AAC.1